MDSGLKARSFQNSPKPLLLHYQVTVLARGMLRIPHTSNFRTPTLCLCKCQLTPILTTQLVSLTTNTSFSEYFIAALMLRWIGVPPNPS
jgi:hypothetical protein